MAETDDFHAEDQLNYEAETGEGGEGDGDEADIGDDPELEAIKVLSPRKYFATDTIFMFSGKSESYGGGEREAEAAAERGGRRLPLPTFLGILSFTLMISDQ